MNLKLVTKICGCVNNERLICLPEYVLCEGNLSLTSTLFSILLTEEGGFDERFFSLYKYLDLIGPVFA